MRTRTCLIPNPDHEAIKTKTKTQQVRNKNPIYFISNMKQEQNKVMTKKHIQNLCWKD